MSETETSVEPDPASISNSSPRPESAAPPHPEADKPDVATTSTLKRNRDEDIVNKNEAAAIPGVPAPKRRLKTGQDLIYRIVVPSSQIGKVIGRGGSRIQKIRDDSRATIKIADAISRHEDRVIIISSKCSDNVFTDAENGLHQVVSLILTDDGNNAREQISAGHVAANTIRLLIAGSQAGGVIGTSGQNIETLRSSSGATITVLAPSQLPPCASANESDRVVQISGDVPAVLRAVVEIGCLLRANQPKQVTSSSQSHKSSSRSQSQQYVDPISAEHVTLDLMVPENLVGGLIGRFGANISRIRNESGANVKVHGGRGERTERQITLTGDPIQVDLARERVDEYVYAELMRQASNQPRISASPFARQPPPHVRPDIPNSPYRGYGHPPPPYPDIRHHRPIHPHPHLPHELYASSTYEAGYPPAPPYVPMPTEPPPPAYYSLPITEQPPPPAYYSLPITEQSLPPYYSLPPTEHPPPYYTSGTTEPPLQYYSYPPYPAPQM